MERDKQQRKLGRRLLLFPAPLQGHITPMLHLANVLHSKGFSITIIHTIYNSPDATKLPHFNFHFINDGLLDKSTPAPTASGETMSLLNASCLEPFQECLFRLLNESASKKEPIACLIADPMWCFCGAVSESLNIPRIALRTGGMSTFLVYHYLPLLREKGFFPLQETKPEEPLPEFALPVKVKDLPSERLHDALVTRVREFETSRGIICNTFEELEHSSLAKIRQLLHIPIFPIGPLHNYSPTCRGSLLIQDKGALSWLSTQPPKSVVYVSFGSIATISEAVFQEIAWGLANSKQPFLWVVRPGLIEGVEASNLLPEDFLGMVSGRGHIVKWAPQQEVLAHPAVGGFWTHCGWNSIVESIGNGVPMICLPFFADQAMNARHVTDSWKIGLQLEKEINREEIERAVRQLMLDEEGDEIRKRIMNLKEKATLCQLKGSSSYEALERLISYLSSL